MSVVLRPATIADRPLLRRMIELYAYDFSEFTGLELGADGHYVTDAWCNDHVLRAPHLFLLEVDGQLAGFAAVDDKSQIDGRKGIHDMLQFFVLRAYRKYGVGSTSAVMLFDMFPGAWEVRQIMQNEAATTFWRKVISRYTGGHYREAPWSDADGSGVVQHFVAP